MKNLLKMTAVSIGFASTALAGSPGPAPEPMAVTVTPPMAAAHDWSGLYVGGLVSFDGGSVAGFTNNLPVSSASLDATTAFGGFVGYNKQINTLVFGGEVAYTTGKIPVTGVANAYVTDRLDVKGRLGVSLGRALVYGFVGYSWADTFNAVTTYPAAGISYGAGLDFMVTDRLFVGAEYLMRNLNGVDVGNRRIDSTINSATIRAGIKF